MRHQRRRSPFAQLWFGGFLILLGLLFLLDNLGLADTHRIIAIGWPLILVAAGASRLINVGSAESRIAGAIWLSVGALFLLSNLGYLPFNVWRLIWPILLIAFGIVMVMRSSTGCSVPVETASKIKSMAFMGGVERRVNSKTFEGGEMTAVMGGCKIDLREADIQGSDANLKVFVMMGGIELFVPEGWQVLSKVVPIMGGFVDRTNPAAAHSKQLVLEGFLLMGGIEVKNF